MDNQQSGDSGILDEAEKTLEVAVIKKELRDAAVQLNKENPDVETITREQIKAAQENAERVADLRRSPKGKFRVLGIDRYDHSDWLEKECDTEEEAVTLAEEKTNAAKKSATDASIATVFYAYSPKGEYIGGDTWKEGERGGSAFTDEELDLRDLIRKIPLLKAKCEPMANPLPGSLQGIPWFRCLDIPDVFISIVNKRPWRYHKRPDGVFKAIHIDLSTPKKEVEKFLRRK